jgi:hypothetical protein
MPVTTSHSVIDSPLSVRRVIPPTITINTTIKATTSSQRAIASDCMRERFAALEVEPARCAWVAIGCRRLGPQGVCASLFAAKGDARSARMVARRKLSPCAM